MLESYLQKEPESFVKSTPSRERGSVIFLTACVKFEGHFELSGTKNNSLLMVIYFIRQYITITSI